MSEVLCDTVNHLSCDEKTSEENRKQKKEDVRERKGVAWKLGADQELLVHQLVLQGYY